MKEGQKFKKTKNRPIILTYTNMGRSRVTSEIEPTSTIAIFLKICQKLLFGTGFDLKK